MENDWKTFQNFLEGARAAQDKGLQEGRDHRRAEPLPSSSIGSASGRRPVRVLEDLPGVQAAPGLCGRRPGWEAQAAREEAAARVGSLRARFRAAKVELAEADAKLAEAE